MARRTVTKKACRECGQVQPLSAFPVHPHGTDGHTNQCKACRAAYVREYRASNPTAYARDRRMIAARARAMERLADLHAGEFTDLYNDERVRAGLPPVGATPVGRKPGWVEQRRAS